MSTQFQVINGTAPTTGIKREADNSVLPQRIAAARAGQQALVRQLEITSVLQTTLDVHQVIELFASEVVLDVPCDGIGYRHAGEDITIEIGQRAVHACTYSLVLMEQDLGELRFMRRKRFSGEEILLLERLLCALTHPLHNALLYQRALVAAHKDALTGLNNRAAMEAALRREVELAHRNGTPFSLIVMDVDHFKSINDNHGHMVGDQAIKALAACAQRAVRCTDMIFRFGGEEFVVLLNNTSERGAMLLAERLRKEVEKCHDIPVAMTISLGVATLRDQEAGTGLLNRADQALYQAKGGGRNRACAAD